MDILLKGIIHDLLFAPSGLTYILYSYLNKSSRPRIKRWIQARSKSISKIEKADIVIHSSSLGETKNSLIFSELIREKLNTDGLKPHIAHTVFTETPFETFRNVHIIPTPLFSVLVKFIPDSLKLLIFYEKDIWPGYILSAKYKGSNIGIVSGKISKRSAELYRKLRMREIFSYVDFVFSAGDEFTERFKYAGFKNVQTSIDLKNLIFIKNHNLPVDKAQKSKAIVGISLRGIEELEFLLKTKEILKDYTLFIAPRHNFEGIKKFMTEKGIDFISLTHISDDTLKSILSEGKSRIVLIDGYGMVDKVLPYASFAFVGGTILPFGGHNVLEPISFGLPVVVGENLWNIKEKNELIESGVMFVVRSPGEFASIIKKGIDRVKILGYVERKRSRAEQELDRIYRKIKEVLGKGF